MIGMLRAANRSGWWWTVGAVPILAVFVGPILLMYSASLQPGATSVSVDLVPDSIDFAAYGQAFSAVLPGIRNSTIVACGSVAIVLLIAVPASYGLSRLDGRIVNSALIAILLTQMVPSITLLNSLYALFNSLGMTNTFPPLILANAANALPFAIIVLRSFMLALDSEVIEASMIDGADAWQRMTRIVLPLSRNAVITAGVFAFIFAWGDLLIGLTLTTQSAMQPVVLSVYRLLDQPSIDWSTVMAGSVLTSLPAIILLVFALRYVKAGISLGSGK